MKVNRTVNEVNNLAAVGGVGVVGGVLIKRSSGRQDSMFIGVLPVRSTVSDPSGRRQVSPARQVDDGREGGGKKKQTSDRSR